MKKKNFYSHKIWHNEKFKLRNIVIIFFSILIWLWSIVALADLQVQTNLANAVQTIKEIIISTDWTNTPSSILYDINTGWKIKIYTERIRAQTTTIFKNKERANDINNNRMLLGIDTWTNDIIFLNKDVFSWALWWWGRWLTWQIWPTGPKWDKGDPWEPWTNWTNWTQWPVGPAWPQWPIWPQGLDWINWIDWFLQEGINWATPYRNWTSRTTTDTNIYNIWNNIWIWIPWTTQIPAKLNVHWMIKMFDIENEKDCNIIYEWTIRYKNKCFQWCDWSNRINLWWEWCQTPATTYQCIWQIQSWAIANNLLPITNNSPRTYSTTPWQCTFTCNTDHTRNTWTNYCCNLPDNSSLYQTWTTITASKRWTSIWWTSLRWVNSMTQTGITYQGWNCNFMCNEWYVRNWDINNPLCLPIISPVCGRGQSLRWWTCHRGQ